MKAFNRFLISSILIVVLLSTTVITAKASGDDKHDAEYKNKETGYVAYIEDRADLLTKSEEKELLEVMKPITQYGNAVYLTLEDNPRSSTASYTEHYYLDELGAYESGIIFCADTYYDYDYMYAEGDIYDLIGKSYATTITDNVYMYDYYEGATKAFTMAYDVIEGRRIAQPMKYICNTFLGLLISLLACFLVINQKSKLKNASQADIIAGSVRNIGLDNVGVNYLYQTKKYSPRSSSSSGGGHGGGGGGHHGGGGGHSH